MTKDTLITFLKSYAKRALIVEFISQGRIEIRVPFWKVKKVKQFVNEVRPVGMQIDVERFSFRAHFKIWKVHYRCVSLPPVHFNCRCGTVIAEEDF